MSRKEHSLTKTGTRCYYRTSRTHFNRGSPPSFPQYTTWRSSKSRQSEFCWNPSRIELKIHDSLVQLYQGRLKQTSHKKARPPWISRSLVLKVQYLSNQTPEARGCLTMKTHVRWLLWLQISTNPHAGAVKKYFVKYTKINQIKKEKSKESKSSISRKPEKAT